ncbi:hypothetical protein [Corynebacterium glyciniphilum]|uniref:hypothetical protein n=1 Tax=Corynebacterium glyciniphilum TaxID=1404244 RepID=UPI003FD4964E
MSEYTHQMRQVIHFFNPGHVLAIPSGEDSFMHRLIRTACKADSKNLDFLYMAFPAVAWSVRAIREDGNGYDKVARAIREEEEAPL